MLNVSNVNLCSCRILGLELSLHTECVFLTVVEEILRYFTYVKYQYNNVKIL